jgi:hypothetical protein
MDGLSAAASVAGVVSLSLQLVEGIKKLHDFLNKVADAPQDIQDTVKELRLLTTFLDRLAEEEEKHPLDPLAVEALQGCNKKVAALLAILERYQPSFSHTSTRRVRTWSSFKATLQKDRLDGLRVSLEETKSTLMLIRQDLSQ